MCLPMLIKWHRLNGGVVVDMYKCMSVEETHVDDYIRLAFRVCYHFAMVHDVRLKLAPFLVFLISLEPNYKLSLSLSVINLY